VTRRVVFLVSNLIVGGAELHTVGLCEALRARGFDCRILVHSSRRSDVVTAMPGASSAVFLNLSGPSDPRGWWTTWRALRALKPDLVVAVNQTPLLIALIERLLFATRARIACIFHTTALQDYEQQHETSFRLISRLTDLLVYVSENQRRVWEKRGIKPRSTRTIHNGIDVARFALARDSREPMRDCLGIGPNILLLGIVAALREEKNHVELVRAFALVRERGVDAHLLVIGDGPTRPKVAALAETLGVAAHVTFAGEQDDVAPFLAACDLGVIPSLTETFPLAALELLATGVPVIASRVGGTYEIVRHGSNGLLYESGEVAQLAEAIIACSDEGVRAALAAQAVPSVDQFTTESMVEAYVDAFESLLVR